MTGIPGQRDPDLIQAIAYLQRQVDDLRSVVVGRWGRVPTEPATTPPDGSTWIDPDLPAAYFQAGGSPVRLGNYHRWDDISTWTPYISATTTDPTPGTGWSSSGAYQVIDNFCFVLHMAFAFGTAGFAAGSGLYYLTLPDGVTPHANSYARPVGRAWMINGGIAGYPVDIEIGADGIYFMQSSWAYVTNASPFAWGTSDEMRVGPFFFRTA